jgi:DNA-directed RNA polymerase omega subunit
MDELMIENKFLKVLVVAQRAKQIQKGGNPHFKTDTTRATRIALEEVDLGLVDYEFREIVRPQTLV